MAPRGSIGLKSTALWAAVIAFAGAGCAAQGNPGPSGGYYSLPSGVVGDSGGSPWADGWSAKDLGVTDLSGAATSDGDAKASDAKASDAKASDAKASDVGPGDAKGGSDTAGLSKIDSDGDGFSPATGDCDESRADVHPGATELCNDRDDDCNGKLDDADGDKDGYSKCPGAGQDCDDDDPEIFPGAKSFCAAGKDGDCDGIPDLEVDNDSDGFPTCNDCDDKDASVHPNAALNCSTKKDHDCNGVIDAVQDADQDGDPACSDCNDKDPKVFKYALETCDGKDEDCNGVTDDMDNDGDGFAGCKQPDVPLDCNDKDLTVNPGAGRNCKNGKDNDCSGVIDAQEDGDGDGFAGCQDCNDYNKLISPGGLEIGGDNIDNNCNGQTDEGAVKCDSPNLSSAVPTDYPKSIGLCAGVVSASFPVAAAANSRAILKSYGVKNLPVGATFVVLSSGVAAAKGQPGYTGVSTSFSNSAPYPPVSCKNSGSVYDYTELKLVIQVPANAKAFAFDFNFMSHEYPVYVGSTYNDKFLAVLDSKAFKGNISFDKNGNCVSINNALFQECDPNAPNKKSTCTLGKDGLVGTGYDDVAGGGTGWLTTTSPVTPGETITLRYIIFDEGDHILDSAVIIDNFRWLASSSTGGPSTVRPGG